MARCSIGFIGTRRARYQESISSRHFEPIGTKTCQISDARHYNGILEADRHYIALASDLRNIDDELRRFQDDDYRQQMVDETYDYVIAEHTYANRISELIETVTGTSGVRVSGKSLSSTCVAAPGRSRRNRRSVGAARIYLRASEPDAAEVDGGTSLLACYRTVDAWSELLIG